MVSVMSHETSNLSGQKCHYKIKNKIMRKFFDEPVDALDLRLTKLEASLTVIPDPWSPRCKEEPQVAPLDYSEDCSEVTSSSNDREDIQFIAASSLKSFRHHPYQNRDGIRLVSPSIARHSSGTNEVRSESRENDRGQTAQTITRYSFSPTGSNSVSTPSDWRQTEAAASPPALEMLKTELLEEDLLDQKISMVEGLRSCNNPLISTVSSENCLEGRLRYGGTGWPQQISPSPEYLARSYQLLESELPWQQIRRPESVIVKNNQAKVLSKVPDWLDNIQRLRSSYMTHHPYHLPGILPRQTTDHQQILRRFFPTVISGQTNTQVNLVTKASPGLRGSEDVTQPTLGLPGTENVHPSSSITNFCDKVKSKTRRGRPRKHAPKVPLPPLYVFIRNLLHNNAYNPSVISWVDESVGCFKISNTVEFARTWGKMKDNRSEEMNYEKMSRAMRYHYGCQKKGRKGHLAMVKEKRLYYRFGELAVNWNKNDMKLRAKPCSVHKICQDFLCLWTKE